jgi:formiminotetrahydrofolate cyclodeaminase
VTGSLGDKSLRDVLEAFAAATPTPGGGSACAAASAIGVALLMKAAAVAGVAEHTLAGLKTQLVDAIDGDARAYMDVIAARRQPKQSEAERAFRAAGIQLALRRATDVPLAIMRLSADALAEARSLATRFHRSTVADVSVAIRLLRASFEGARTTVDANLGTLTDVEYATAAGSQSARLSEQAMRDVEEAERLLRIG